MEGGGGGGEGMTQKNHLARSFDIFSRTWGARRGGGIEGTK